MPKTKAEAAYKAALQLNEHGHIIRSGMMFSFSTIKRRPNDILIDLRHSNESEERYLVSIPVDEFVRVKAIYPRGYDKNMRLSTSTDISIMQTLFDTYPPASRALEESVRKVAAADVPLPPRREPKAADTSVTGEQSESTERTMSVDVRAPSTRMVAAAAEVAERMEDEEEEQSESDLDEVAEKALGPVYQTKPQKEIAKEIDKRRKAAEKAFREVKRRRARAVIRAAHAGPVVAAAAPRNTPSDISSTHQLLYEIAIALPEPDQAEALGDIAKAGTDMTELARVWQKLMEKRATLAKQRAEQIEARKPKAKSRKQVMSMVRKLKVAEPEPTTGLPRTLHLTSEQAERLRNKLNAAYEAASASRASR